MVKARDWIDSSNDIIYIVIEDDKYGVNVGLSLKNSVSCLKGFEKHLMKALNEKKEAK
jgi:hypothetical protein